MNFKTWISKLNYEQGGPKTNLFFDYTKQRKKEGINLTNTLKTGGGEKYTIEDPNAETFNLCSLSQRQKTFGIYQVLNVFTSRQLGKEM